MVGYKAAVELISENLRKGKGPKSSKAGKSILESIANFGENTPGLDKLRFDLELLILNLESEELRKEMETAPPTYVTPVVVPIAQGVPGIPVREVPDFKPAVARQDLRAQLAVQVCKVDRDRWLASEE